MTSGARLLQIAVASVVLVMLAAVLSTPLRAVCGIAGGLLAPVVLLAVALQQRLEANTSGAAGIAIGVVFAYWSLGSLLLLWVGVGPGRVDSAALAVVLVALCAAANRALHRTARSSYADRE